MVFMNHTHLAVDLAPSGKLINEKILLQAETCGRVAYSHLRNRIEKGIIIPISNSLSRRSHVH
jgi:hypothetical protein